MKRLLGIILFLLCLVSTADAGFRKHFDFEPSAADPRPSPVLNAPAEDDGGPDEVGQDPNNGGIYYSQDHNGGQRGLWVARADFKVADNYQQNYTTRGIYNINPPEPIVKGDMIYMHAEVYWSSADVDFHFGNYNNPIWTVKFFRLNKRGPDIANDNQGMNSLMLASWKDWHTPLTRPWMDFEEAYPNGTQAFSWDGYNSNYLKPDEWNYLDVSYELQYTLTADVDLTITNSQYPNGKHYHKPNMSTIGGTSLWFNGGWLWSTWNAGVVQDQSIYTDNYYISNINDYYSWKGGAPDPSPQPTPQPDDTPPTVVSVTPANGSGSVSIDLDPIFLIQISDQESGNNASTARLIFNGNNESEDLASSGDLSNTSFYLTNSNLNTPLNYSTGCSWEFGITDYLGNQMSESGNLTTEVAPVIGTTIFATGDMGDQANYTEYSDNWQLVNESGNVKYLIDNSAYEGWEYTLYDLTTYQYWDITGKVRCDDNLTTNLYADWVFIFNYVDHNNFDFVQFNSNASLNGVWRRVLGENIQIYQFNTALVTDNAEGTFEIKNDNGTIRIYLGGVEKYSTNVVTVNKTKIGFGSQNDQFAFDDIVITDIEAQPSPPPPSSPTPSGKVYNKGGSVLVNSTGNRILKR